MCDFNRPRTCLPKQCTGFQLVHSLPDSRDGPSSPCLQADRCAVVSAWGFDVRFSYDSGSRAAVRVLVGRQPVSLCAEPERCGDTRLGGCLLSSSLSIPHCTPHPLLGIQSWHHVFGCVTQTGLCPSNHMDSSKRGPALEAMGASDHQFQGVSQCPPALQLREASQCSLLRSRPAAVTGKEAAHSEGFWQSSEIAGADCSGPLLHRERGDEQGSWSPEADAGCP